MRLEPDDEGGFSLTLYAVADEGEIYAPHAAESIIGQRMPVGVGADPPEFMGTVTEAKVVNDGKALEITIKLDKSSADPAEIARYLSGASKWAN